MYLKPSQNQGAALQLFWSKHRTPRCHTDSDISRDIRPRFSAFFCNFLQKICNKNLLQPFEMFLLSLKWIPWWENKASHVIGSTSRYGYAASSCMHGSILRIQSKTSNLPLENISLNLLFEKETRYRQEGTVIKVDDVNVFVKHARTSILTSLKEGAMKENNKCL